MYGREVAEEYLPSKIRRLRCFRGENSGYQGFYELTHMEEIDIRTTYSCSPDYFLYLYNRVGKPWRWFEMNELPKDKLVSWLKNQRVISLLKNGEPIGFGSIEEYENTSNISYFGLVPEAIGKGYGRKFLSFVTSMAFDNAKLSVSLYTTDTDHPNAYPSYLKEGFKLEECRTIYQYAPILIFHKEEI